MEGEYGGLCKYSFSDVLSSHSWVDDDDNIEVAQTKSQDSSSDESESQSNENNEWRGIGELS